jgi:hypothetical protein
MILSKFAEMCVGLPLDKLKFSNREYKFMNIRSLLSGIEFELPVRLWTGEATHGFEKLLVCG